MEITSLNRVRPRGLESGLGKIADAWSLHSSWVHGELAALVRAIEASGSPAVMDFLEQARELWTARSR